MKQKLRFIVLLLVLATLTMSLAACGDTATAGADVTVLEKGKSSSSVLVYGDGELSKDAVSLLRDTLAKNGYQRFNSFYHYKVISEANEIIVGDTDRAASKKAMELLDKKVSSAPSDHHWAFCYDGGKLAIVANSSIAYELAFSALLSGYTQGGALIVKDNLSVASTRTLAEYNAFLEEQARLEAEKKKEENKQLLASLLPKVEEQREVLNEHRGKINPYSSSGSEINLFVQYTQNIGTTTWGAISSDYTLSDEHPRLLVTKAQLPALRTSLSKKTVFNEEFFRLLDLKIVDDCILPPATSQGINETVSKENYHNYNDEYLEIIQAKALGYLAYGDELYGYQAIYYMKNFLKSLDIKQIASDQCREYGFVMFTTALVYDWCYDLLTDVDKTQFIAGVENCLCRGSNAGGVKMEVGFPPAGQGSVMGHGSEFQILRDYLSFAVAIYDENPSWWNYVGARVINDFTQMRNHYFSGAGIPHQGTGYATTRHVSDLYSAWIIKVATGKNPYVGMETTIRGLLGYEVTPGKLFSDGDTTGDYRDERHIVDIGYISAYLYADATVLAQAQYIGGDNLFTSTLAGITNPVYIALTSLSNIEPASDRYEDLDLIHYYGAPLGQYVIREAWNDPSSAAVLMRIKERSTGNHEHCDSGTFEIYYKGMLTSDGGCYNNYNHAHTQYFHQATISHNGLIIYNSNKRITQGSWYSGGQRKINGGGGNTFSSWLSAKTLDTGTVTGRQHAYSDAEETSPLYAYIAGDITKAYDTDTAYYVGRRMLTVYTGDEEFPMVFFVFDDITSVNKSYKKRFLLQISSKQAPTIGEDSYGNGTVITENGDGRLILTSLSDNVSINPQGGRNTGDTYDASKSHNYLIEGRQCIPQSNRADDGHWGRVEIEYTKDEKDATFLNVITVTDKGNETMPSVRVTTAENGLTGGVFGKSIAVLFATSRERATTEMSCTTKGDGKMSYYVSGVAAGNWTVSVDGQTVGTYSATEDGGLLTFEAPAGSVTITPAK